MCVCVLHATISLLLHYIIQHEQTDAIITEDSNEKESRLSSASYTKYHDRTETRCLYEQRMENNHSPDDSEDQVHICLFI